MNTYTVIAKVQADSEEEAMEEVGYRLYVHSSISVAKEHMIDLEIIKED